MPTPTRSTRSKCHSQRARSLLHMRGRQKVRAADVRGRILAAALPVLRVASGTPHSTTRPDSAAPIRGGGECVQLGAACALLLLAALVLALKHAPMLAVAYAASFGALP